MKFLRNTYLKLATTSILSICLSLVLLNTVNAAAAPKSMNEAVHSAKNLTVYKVREDHELNQKWRHFGNSGGGWFNNGGWAAADATYSVPLPDGLDAWLFADTFLGPVNKNQTLPANAKFIHNSIVLATHRSHQLLTTITGGTHKNPLSLVRPSIQNSNHWYWNENRQIFTPGS